ncbi:MAG: hypothetical protein LBM60_08735 [Clostridium sp.]|jgi:hypothetical protein|nr:hypothetical protein [Clostridium sp.]
MNDYFGNTYHYPYQTNQPKPMYKKPAVKTPAVKNPYKTFGIIGMSSGILSILCICVSILWFFMEVYISSKSDFFEMIGGFLSLILMFGVPMIAIFGLVCSIICLSKGTNWYSIIGIVFAALALIFTILLYVGILIVIGGIILFIESIFG